FYSACAAGPGTGGSTAARVLAVPGSAPGSAFTVERYVQPTCEAAAWEADGAAEPLALAPPTEVGYVALPLAADDAAPDDASPDDAAPDDAAPEAERREQGRLAAGDQTLASGEYFDEYAVA